MTQAVTVRRDGDTFQARLFWQYAAKLLDPKSPIRRVGFENGPKAFDDIWVEYEPEKGPLDQFGEALRRIHIQCKWHVAPDVYGYRDLVEPQFINANARSLLQRAHVAQLEHAPEGSGVRFKLLTNWRLDRADAMQKMISNRSESIRIDRLFSTPTDGSKAGLIRKTWRDHLGIDDEELRSFARSLAFGQATDSLDGLREQLDILFGYVGLRRIPAHETGFIYDDLVFQWMAQGRVEYDRTSFRHICSREGIVDAGEGRPRVYGVKSFEHGIDQIENRCDQVLNLVPLFDTRFIRSESDWSENLYPRIRSFLLNAARETDAVRLVLDAHSSLAFAAGSVLDVKSGRRVEIEQRSLGRKLWSFEDQPYDTAWPKLLLHTEEISPENAQTIVALGITHNILADVREFLQNSAMPVGRIISLVPENGAGPQAVACGRHGLELAQQAVEAIRKVHPKGKDRLVHLFLSAPNTFSFALGQHHRLVGPTLLYEFDFEGDRDGSYTPSIRLPLEMAPS